MRWDDDDDETGGSADLRSMFSSKPKRGGRDDESEGEVDLLGPPEKKPKVEEVKAANAFEEEDKVSSKVAPARKRHSFFKNMQVVVQF